MLCDVLFALIRDKFIIYFLEECFIEFIKAHSLKKSPYNFSALRDRNFFIAFPGMRFPVLID